MQNASNKTRAYYKNANALKGFLVPHSIITLLRSLEEEGQLEAVKKQQDIDIKALLKSLEEKNTHEEIAEHLGDMSPALCILILTKLDK